MGVGDRGGVVVGIWGVGEEMGGGRGGFVLEVGVGGYCWGSGGWGGEIVVVEDIVGIVNREFGG